MLRRCRGASPTNQCSIISIAGSAVTKRASAVTNVQMEYPVGLVHQQIQSSAQVIEVVGHTDEVKMYSTPQAGATAGLIDAALQLSVVYGFITR
jgi:flagellar motor protein MotB